MLVFILRRLIQAAVVMVTVAFIAFMLFQYVGDPVTSLLGQDATQEQRDALRHDTANLGLLVVDRILFSAVHYPAAYGFIPRTLALDDLVFGGWDPISANALTCGAAIEVPLIYINVSVLTAVLPVNNCG